ncbi:MAG: crossover junction endodeoxyribonuclease RuvC [Candidatus Kapaibacteriota bacterium]
MKILGVDPGSIICGFGIIEIINSDVVLVDFGVIRPRKISSVSFLDTLKVLYDKITEILIQNQIEETALESQFYHRNAQSLIKLTQARTAVQLAAINQNIPIFEYTPREIKLSVTGKGGASKISVRYMVNSILNIKVDENFYDASDALAVAICHHFRKHSIKEKYRNSLQSWREFATTYPERIINK